MLGALATPIFIGIAMVATGAGHGSFLSTLVFYPIPLLLLFLQPVDIDGVFLKGILDNIIMALAFVIAIIQFPAYGFIISYSGLKKDSKFWTMSKIIIWMHIIISVILLPYALIARV